MMLWPFSKRRMMPRISSPLAVLELVVDDVALGIAHALQQHLLGRLCGDATEGAARLLHVEHLAELLVLLARALGIARMPEHLETELLADLGLEAVLARDVESDLALRFLDRFHHGHVLEEIDVTRVGIEARLELARWPERGLRGLEDRCLHRLDEDLLVDALFLGDLLDNAAEIDVEARSVRCHGITCSALACGPFARCPLIAGEPWACRPALRPGSIRTRGARCR